MEKKARARLTPLAIVAPIVVCLIIGAFTDAIAMRAGYPAVLAAIFAGVIGILWLGFFVSRLLG
jgi:uncharacterized membrane protein YeaQ/YmgE (transglycosylase-associated protein family)